MSQAFKFDAMMLTPVSIKKPHQSETFDLCLRHNWNYSNWEEESLILTEADLLQSYFLCLFQVKLISVSLSPTWYTLDSDTVIRPTLQVHASSSALSDADGKQYCVSSACTGEVFLVVLLLCVVVTRDPLMMATKKWNLLLISHSAETL